MYSAVPHGGAAGVEKAALSRVCERANMLPTCERVVQDSSKAGAVETGCSGLHYIIGCFIIVTILPQSTAPPSHCTPL